MAAACMFVRTRFRGCVGAEEEDDEAEHGEQRYEVDGPLRRRPRRPAGRRPLRLRLQVGRLHPSVGAWVTRAVRGLCVLVSSAITGSEGGGLGEDWENRGRLSGKVRVIGSRFDWALGLRMA